MQCRILAVASLFLIESLAFAQQPAPSPKVDFAHEVVPILKARCAKCHTNGTAKGGFSFDTRQELLKGKGAVPGQAKASAIIQRVTHADPEMRMPPQGDPLPAKEVAVLRQWIDEGLTWEPGYTFKQTTYVAPLKPRRVVLPRVSAVGRDHPIDRIVDHHLALQKSAPPQPLDDAAFLRRVSLDLIGLLPTEAELQAFQSDSAADKRTKWIQKLLAEDRSYTDHWLAFWNDLLRNEYKGTGYIDGGRKQITAWLYKSLLTNKPYDQFVRELINPTAESEGFIRGIKWRGAVNASQVVELQFAQNIGQVFFGANLKCASCHDSFIDNWKLEDAYGLAAVMADKPLAVHRCDKPTGTTATVKFLFPELGTLDPSQPKAKRLEQLAALVTHSENGRFARTIVNRFWHRLFGHGIVHPVDVMGNAPWNADLLDHLANYLVENKYDLKKLLEHMVTSQAYQSRAVPQASELTPDTYLFRGPELKRMSAEQFVDAIWQLTGTAPAKAVAPAAIPAFSDSIPPERRFVRATLVDCDDLMRSLGRPNREQVVTTRPDQLTTLQALDLANGQTLTNTLARGAANILKGHPNARAEELAEKLFQRALSRKPKPEELAAARSLLGEKPNPESMADFLWVIAMLPEFQLIR